MKEYYLFFVSVRDYLPEVYLSSLLVMEELILVSHEYLPIENLELLQVKNLMSLLVIEEIAD
jgi:hypothetical protein